MTSIRLSNTERLEQALKKRREVNQELMTLTARVYSKAIAEDNSAIDKMNL